MADSQTASICSRPPTKNLNSPFCVSICNRCSSPGLNLKTGVKSPSAGDAMRSPVGSGVAGRWMWRVCGGRTIGVVVGCGGRIGGGVNMTARLDWLGSARLGGATTAGVG